MAQTDAALVARLVKAGLLPSLVEDALAAAEAAGQELPTENDAARDAVITEADIAQAQAMWWYDKTVPMHYKRLLTARVRNAPAESLERGTGLDEFNPYHDKATGQFAASPGVPSDAIEFSGSLYHSTSRDNLQSILDNGLTITKGARQQDAVYFTRAPEMYGANSGVVVQVDIAKAQLAPSSRIYLELQAQTRHEFEDDYLSGDISKNDIVRIARERFNALGYDGYEQGFSVIAITNLGLLRNPRLAANTKPESHTHPANLDEFNPYHDPATGEFTTGGGGLRATPAEIRLSHHAFQRMQERKKYNSVKQTLRKLIGQPTPPGEWYVAMKRNGALDGYLVGVDGVVKTVLGSWYNQAKLSGVEVVLAEAVGDSKLSVRRSIAWQLDNLTPEMVAVFCEIAGRDTMTPDAFRAWWADWTPDGLECLLIARSEAEDHAA